MFYRVNYAQMRPINNCETRMQLILRVEVESAVVLYHEPRNASRINKKVLEVIFQKNTTQKPKILNRLKSQASPLVLQQFRPPSMRLKSQQATISEITSPNSVLAVCMRIKIKLHANQN
jgi:hypothetical protein